MKEWEDYEKRKTLSEKEIKKFRETTADSIQQSTLNSLVIMVYNLLSGTLPRRFTTMYKLTRTICLRLGEYEEVKSLDGIYSGIRLNKKVLLPMATAEYILARDSPMNYSPMKPYHGSAFTFMQIIEALNNSEIEMMDIFTTVCLNHDIDVNATQITRPELGESGELPQL
jgi:hypothetical protein